LPEVSKMTSTGSMVGTPQYMSPEQVLGGSTVDFRTDLWAVAVVAYHGLTGDVPFQGETLGSLCVAIANGRFVPPSARRAGLPASVDRWFERALAVDRERRFASAKELMQSFSLAISPGATLENVTTGEGLATLDATLAYPRVSSPFHAPPAFASAPRSSAVAPRADRAVASHTNSPSIVPAPPPPAAGEGARRPWLAFLLAGLVVLAGVGFFLWSGPGGSTGVAAAPVPESRDEATATSASALVPAATAGAQPSSTSSAAASGPPSAAPATSSSASAPRSAASPPTEVPSTYRPSSAASGGAAPRPALVAPTPSTTAKDRGF